MKTSRLAAQTARLAVVCCLTLASYQAFGQSKQYQRKATPKPKVNTDAVTVTPTTPDASKPATPADAKTVPEAAAGEKKVDVSDLEKKYWVPKDTEFQVVQNRTYTKANRLALTFGTATMINDQYSSGLIYDFMLNYYFSERYGIQAQFMRFDSQDAETVSEFRNTYKVIPDFNRVQQYMGVSFNWVPIYAKLSLLEQQIVYFDLSISPGFGMTEYSQQYLYASPTMKTSPTFSFDIAQHFFLGRHWALRIDFMNRLFNEEVQNARNPGEVKRTKLNHQMIIQGGISFHF
jgi:outer membrane beta-barrel protein